MLRIKTNMNLVDRFDGEVSGALAAGTGVAQGSWTIKNGDALELPTVGAAGALQIFTESNRDGTDGWAPQATASHKDQLTVLLGKYRASTDRFNGTPAPGDKLGVAADGNLAVMATAPTGDEIADTGTVVAVCTKGSHTERHLQKDYDMIEFITV